MNFATAFRHPELFGPWFSDSSWDTWAAVLKAAFAVTLNRHERRLFNKVAGARNPQQNATREFWAVCGRRTAKTLIGAALGSYYAACVDHSRYLKPGEVAVVPLIACDRRQATVLFNYVAGFFREISAFADLVESDTRESITLVNGASIEVFVRDPARIRGRTVPCAVLDECAFWPASLESAAPDVETLRSIRPSMATVPHPLLIGLSSPHVPAGLLYEKFAEHFGKDSETLVIHAPSSVLNPTLSEQLIEDELRADPEGARSEWLAEFRSGIAGLLSREWITAAVMPGRFEIPPLPGVQYFGFADPSGGKADSFALGVGHWENDRVILDCLRGIRPPFSPAEATAELAEVAKRYGVSTIHGDRYAGEWPGEEFAKHEIHYRPSTRDRTAIYSEAQVLFSTGRASILDNPDLFRELLGLERRSRPGAKTTIDHRRGLHDDMANVACGVLLLAHEAGDPGEIGEPLITDGEFSDYTGPDFDSGPWSIH